MADLAKGEAALGENVLLSESDGVLTITVDLAQDCGLTSTGKSTMVAKTGGWQVFYVGGVRYKVNMNVIKMAG